MTVSPSSSSLSAFFLAFFSTMGASSFHLALAASSSADQFAPSFVMTIWLRSLGGSSALAASPSMAALTPSRLTAMKWA